jgi:isoleucyl-tRNA synthetase
MAFKKVDIRQSFPKMEEEILKFWDDHGIFEKSVEKNPEEKSFIFYEGPPTANGKPGLHHVLARAFKDVIPRYKTMKGFRVERKAGWDTHGLPVELQVEKALGLKNKQDIENIVPGNPRESIIQFNKKCKESVWEYKDLWEKLTKRMAYWVDMKNPYITYDNRYIESVWWVIAQIFKLKNKKGEPLVYKGHKVIPYCYRCGTALSSHEVAQGYQTVKENSITIKFKLKDDHDTYVLAWTTTPWTLPGNVALAVGKDIDYVKVECHSERSEESQKKTESFENIPGSFANAQDDRYYILAEDRLENVFPENNYEIVKEFKGEEIIGKSYEPLYKLADNENAYKIVSADFVSTEDGTGVVHIAPAFGEDDANVGKENDLPTLITVDDQGNVDADVPGKGIPVKKKNEKNRYAVDELIIEDLKKRGLFFSEQEYEHEYPFCWRCDTPLIYYAKPSWFIGMSELSDELVKNNENTNWIPEHIKEGRFGEWLRGVKDWAISRERYWGTPMPIWQCKGCNEIKVVESVDEIREQLGNPSKLFLVRHGEAENNVKEILSCYPEKNEWHLTENGKNAVSVVAEQLKNENIDIILSSPLLRTRETAEIISKATGVEVLIEENLRETEMGKFNGNGWDTWKKIKEKYQFEQENLEGVETHVQVKKRMEAFLEDVNKKYQGKNIVVVSHGDPLRSLKNICQGKEISETLKEDYPANACLIKVYSKPFDLHKPFIDDVKFKCRCGGEMERVSEVLDVWFDSGSMPTAQFFYPNQATKEDKEKIESGGYYPADYISEAIDQTRGWFYTLHAISTLLNKAGKTPTGYAFKNVICLAHILDAKGKKMSKSRGNMVDPMATMDEYGADMLRWMLFTINQPGLPKKFDAKGMKDIMNRVFRMLWNSYSFFVMYANVDKWQPSENQEQRTTNLLDKWILSELNMLTKNIDEKLANYDVYASAKSIEKFIDNLSNWYIRRSRKRFWKSENDSDKNEAYATLHHVLVELSKLMAPYTPFISEEIYRNLMSSHAHPLAEKEHGGLSVHLTDFPVADGKMIDEKLNEEMNVVRNIISEGLQLRAKAGIKVRQPLKVVSIKYKVSSEELINVIKEELNVKDVEIDKESEENIRLDIEITEDLKLEGIAREVVRFIQEMRKEAGYEIENRINVSYQGHEKVFEIFGDLIAKETLANSVSKDALADFDLEKEFDVEGEKAMIKIKKA